MASPSKRKREPESDDGQETKRVERDPALEDEAPQKASRAPPDFTEDYFDYTPAAGKFLNFVIDKFSLPFDEFEMNDDEDDDYDIHERLRDHLWEEAYDNPVSYMRKERRSLLLQGESESYKKYQKLVRELIAAVKTRKRFGDYRTNDNNKLVKLFRVFRDNGPNDQLRRFYDERLRLLELPVKQSAISLHIHDKRLTLASMKAEFVEMLEELKALYGDFPGDDFVYNDTPIEQRGGFPPPKKRTDSQQFEWDTWDGTALDF